MGDRTQVAICTVTHSFNKSVEGLHDPDALVFCRVCPTSAHIRSDERRGTLEAEQVFGTFDMSEALAKQKMSKIE